MLTVDQVKLAEENEAFLKSFKCCDQGEIYKLNIEKLCIFFKVSYLFLLLGASGIFKEACSIEI